MKTNYLILGATGSIGYAFTKTLLENKTSATILVRNKEKATKLFGDNSLLEIVEGDAMDLGKLKEVASGKQFIFHGINYPYDKWEANMDLVTGYVIVAASHNNSTIIFPGNIYEFGNVKEITEDMVPNPTTKKGKIRLKLFNMLKNATEEEQCKVIFIRLPDFFGPNVVNGLTERIFGNAVKNKKINWLIRSDVPHQFAYTPDAAKLMYQICLKDNRQNFILYNYASFIVPSFNAFAVEIAKQTGGPSKVQNLPKFVMNLTGMFMPVMRELKENFYLFENSVNLNDEKVRKDFPEFQHTALEQAVSDTLEWFGENV